MDKVSYKSNQKRTEDYVKNFDREKVLKSLIRPNNPIIFDVGAATGQSLHQFKKWWPNCEVHCFEPQPKLFNEMVHEPNNQFKNVRYNEFALGDITKDAQDFYSHKVQPMLGGFDRLNVKSKDSVAINKPELVDMEDGEFIDGINQIQLVNVITLEEYVKEFNIDEIDILKLDTQGWESKILKGAGSFLSNIKIVLAELNFYDLYEHQHSFLELEKYLLPQGFKLFDINHISKNPMNGRTDWVDVIYIKE